MFQSQVGGRHTIRVPDAAREQRLNLSVDSQKKVRCIEWMVTRQTNLHFDHKTIEKIKKPRQEVRPMIRDPIHVPCSQQIGRTSGIKALRVRL